MSQSANQKITFADIITLALQIDGVRVDRERFLYEQFRKETPEQLYVIMQSGPVLAGYDKELLQKKAHKIIMKRTALSTTVSFAAGLPGGFALVATVPADILQFYGIALRMAQELAYLYGEEDLWKGEDIDEEKVQGKMLMYCGVMLGVSGAAQAMRIMSSSFAKQTAKKIPQFTVSKAAYRPIMQSIAKASGAKVGKSAVTKSASKIVPLVGGVVCGAITYAAMRPMGERLQKNLEKTRFGYSEGDFEADWQYIMEEQDTEPT